MCFVPIAEAIKISRHNNAKAFYQWRRRVNRTLPPHQRIIIDRGAVELHSLETALAAHIQARQGGC